MRDTSRTAENLCSGIRTALSLCSLGLWVAGELTESTLSNNLINLMNLISLMKQSAHRTSNRLACLLRLDQLIVESRIEGIAHIHRPLGPKLTNHQRLACEGNSTDYRDHAARAMTFRPASLFRSSILNPNWGDTQSRCITKVQLPPLSYRDTNHVCMAASLRHVLPTTTSTPCMLIAWIMGGPLSARGPELHLSLRIPAGEPGSTCAGRRCGSRCCRAGRSPAETGLPAA